jgi:hypothetical protein
MLLKTCACSGVERIFEPVFLVSYECLLCVIPVVGDVFGVGYLFVGSFLGSWTLEGNPLQNDTN